MDLWAGAAYSGCDLTLPPKANFTGTVVVSIFAAIQVAHQIHRVPFHRRPMDSLIWIATVMTIVMLVAVSWNGVAHRMVPRSIRREAVFLP